MQIVFVYWSADLIRRVTLIRVVLRVRSPKMQHDDQTQDFDRAHNDEHLGKIQTLRTVDGQAINRPICKSPDSRYHGCQTFSTLTYS